MRYKLFGLIAIGLIVVVSAAIIGAYRQVFTPVVNATVLADRSGLLTDPGADVTIRGVTVGKVRTVRPNGDGAALSVALEPDKAELIPADVTAQVLAPTVFGAKFVDLVPPPGGLPATVTAPIVDGTVIRRVALPTETDPVFEHLVTLLDSVDAAKLNSGLGALSTALQGRGDEAGRLVGQLNTYLKGLQPSVSTLAADLGKTGDVGNVYADATPDLFHTTDNVSSISGTLVDEDKTLEAFLLDLSGLADNANGFFDDNEHGLRESLDVTAPVTALTARYSPEFTCLFASTNQLRHGLEATIGGGQPAIHLLSGVLPTKPGYRNPRDRPKTGALDGPSCYGGPIAAAAPRFQRVQFDDGSAGAFGPSTGRPSTTPSIAEQLFGKNAGLITGRPVSPAAQGTPGFLGPLADRPGGGK